MNTHHMPTETDRNIEYHQLIWPADNAPDRNNYEDDEYSRKKSNESFLCVISFIAILALACVL